MLDRFKVRVLRKYGGDVVSAVAWPFVVVLVAAAAAAAAACVCGRVREGLRGLRMAGCCSSV